MIQARQLYGAGDPHAYVIIIDFFENISLENDTLGGIAC